MSNLNLSGTQTIEVRNVLLLGQCGRLPGSFVTKPDCA
jgi:hypothetical protein